MLFENEADLLQRFCFILRIACKIPNQKKMNNLGNNTKIDKVLTHAIFLKPYGPGWDAIIHFLLTEKQRLSEKLLPHIISILSEWADQIDINDNPPSNAREAGLLSLYLLGSIKNSYEHKDERIKLLGVIIRQMADYITSMNSLTSCSQNGIRCFCANTFPIQSSRLHGMNG